MAVTITDTNDFEITLNTGDTTVIIWKQNIRFGVISGNILPFYWHDKAMEGRYNHFDLDYTDVSSPVAAHAEDLKGKIQNMIRSGWGGLITPDGTYGDIIVTDTGATMTVRPRANRLFNYLNLK